MSDSATAWLAAREIADVRSRSKELAAAFAALVGPDDLVVDLGCGTGANFRYLDRYLAPNQKWLGIDHDDEVLSQAAVRVPTARVAFERMDLATDLRSVPLGQSVAVTASAFLDITSNNWLTQLASHCRDTPLLIAMSAASQPEWHPMDDLDEPIRRRIETHQRSDHGFGTSLGPDAAQRLVELLRTYGCQVTLRRSDWTLAPEDRSLIAMMIRGVARRVASMRDSIDVNEWESRRRDQLQRGELRLVVKHVDLLSIPQELASITAC